MNRIRIFAAGAAITAVAVGAYFLLSNDTAGEVVELVADGGERILREPMRPASGGQRVLLIALDGVGENDLLTAIREGRLPSVAVLLGEESEPRLFAHGYAVPDVLSVLPSTTLAAWTSLFTGEPPARSGVPGNEWFDRSTATFYAPAPVSVSGTQHSIEVYSESLLDSLVAVPTLFERADRRSYVSLAHVHRGADLLTVPDLGALGDVVTSVVQGVAQDTEVTQEIYRDLDVISVERALSSIERHGPADLQVVYLPGIDLFTHVAADPIASQRRYLQEVIDPALGQLFDAYRGAGVLDETYVLFVSDHGHTPVLEDDRHALGVGEPDEPTALLELAGFRVRAPELELAEGQRDFQAVVAYQGAFAYIYLADRSRCPNPGDVCDWSAPPRFDEDVLPVVRAMDAASRLGEGVPELLGTLDLIFARQPVGPGEDALPYQVWSGDRLVDTESYLGATPRPELLRFADRLEDLSAGPRGHTAGDVMLLANSGTPQAIEERFYFSSPYRSWHGSPTAEDSRIPLLVIQPAGTGEEVRSAVQRYLSDEPSQLDITPLVEGLLRPSP